MAGNAWDTLLDGEILESPSACGAWGEKGGRGGGHAVEGDGGDMAAEVGEGGTEGKLGSERGRSTRGEWSRVQGVDAKALKFE